MSKFLTFCVVLNTVLLLALTVMHNPITEALNILKDRHEKHARAKMCYAIIAHEKQYGDFAGAMFEAGCLYTIRENLRSKTKTEQEEKVLDKVFEEQSSILYEKASTWCQEGASRYKTNPVPKLGTPISQTMLQSLLNDMQCNKVDTQDLLAAQKESE